MSELVSFGDPKRFEIALRWVEDHEPRERRPAHGGWSTGDMRLTVGGHVLTQHELNAGPTSSVRWYLLSVFEWLAENWISLLHEERFAWRENSAAPAATAVFLALRRHIDSDVVLGQVTYDEIHAWWSRHALRAADASALYPDLVLRRLIDDIEISWTARQPSHAPERFRFSLAPGAATLSVAQVAEPLWEALEWVVKSARSMLEDEQELAEVDDLCRRILELQDSKTMDLERWYLPDNLFYKVRGAVDRESLLDTSIRLPRVPAISGLDNAVLMFGGVSPDIGGRDLEKLTRLLASKKGGTQSEELSAIVDMDVGAPISAPFEEGYELAEQLLDDLSLPGKENFVDVRYLVCRLGIEVLEDELRTSTIRGVAIAGTDFAPTILINKTSQYNATEAGKRFTLAHELFHILYDQVRAKRITHISGPWTSPGVEKRANAFAAMFLMPRRLVAQSIHESQITPAHVEAAAEAMQVGVSAFVEHLYNISLIDETERDTLRTHFGLRT